MSRQVNMARSTARLDEFMAAPITLTFTRRQWQSIFASLEVSFSRTIYEPEELHAQILAAVEKVEVA